MQEPEEQPEAEPEHPWRKRLPAILAHAKTALAEAMPAVHGDPTLRYWLAAYERAVADHDANNERYAVSQIETRALQVAAYREAHDQEVWQRTHPRSPPWERPRTRTTPMLHGPSTMDAATEAPAAPPETAAPAKPKQRALF